MKKIRLNSQPSHSKAEEEERSSCLSSLLKKCPNCEKVFTRRENLRYHAKRKHNVCIDKLKNFPTRNMMRCMECELQFLSLKKLTDHLVVCHSMTFPEFKKTFRNHTEFHRWKELVEERSKNGYSQMCGTSVSKFGKTTYYHCNRSGHVKSKVTTRIRSRGTFKINRHCTSWMKVLEDKNGLLHVTYSSTHYGHTSNTDTRRRKNYRAKIAEKGNVKDLESLMRSANEVIDSKPGPSSAHTIDKPERFCHNIAHRTRSKTNTISNNHSITNALQNILNDIEMTERYYKV